MNQPVMKVHGKGYVEVPPDTIRMVFTLIAFNKDYALMMQEAADQLQQLRTVLQKSDFTKEELKTRSFDVQTLYDTVLGPTQQYEQVFKGYQARHTLYLDFPLNNQRLSMVLNDIASADIQPEISIQYLLKDSEQLKSLLLTKAVQDAKQNADILASANGVTIGRVLEINDHQEPIITTSAFTQTSPKMMALDFTPDVVSQEVNISIIYAIHS